MTWAFIASVCIGLAVTHKIFETDFWQHLVVGKDIWTTHTIPTLQLWSWPTYGTVDTTSSYSWLFRFLVYPFWALGGVSGLFVWRWLTTLAAFALLWRTSRVLGGRGLVPYLVLILCALVYRQRSQVRPETLAAILFAATLLLLELRRADGKPRALALVVIQWLWVNVHVSYYLGFLLILVHLFNDVIAGRNAPGGRRFSLLPVLAAAAVLGFVNPYGWRALWMPFHYFLVLRHEDIYRSIGEVRPLDWGWNLRNGFPAVLFLWIGLQAWRARRGRIDVVELLLSLIFTIQSITAVRFIGFWALVAAPYLSRDLCQWTARQKWQAPQKRWAASLGAVSCAALMVNEFVRPDLPFGVGLVASSYPRYACDFMDRFGIRGRVLNSFDYGGYMLWRFWPERARLPFMDIHQAGTARERYAYMYAHAREEGWRTFKDQYAPDVVLVRRLGIPGDFIKDFVDRDTSWALVFADDVAALYVRRQGVPRALLDRHAYALVSGGRAGLARIEEGVVDTGFRKALRPELDRMIAESPLNSIASSFRATVNIHDRRLVEAEADIEHAHAVDPLVPFYHYTIGQVALLRGDPRRALTHYQEQERLTPGPDLEMSIAQLHLRLGNVHQAKTLYDNLTGSGIDAPDLRDSLRSRGVLR